MKLGSILPAAVLAVLLPCGAAAGVDKTAGLKEIREAAQRGDAEAQLELGILYEFGYGMTNNQIAALAWYNLAAKQGQPKAAARADLLKKRLPPGDVEKADSLSTKLLGKQPATAK
jgi:localization factor PodJL